MNTTLPQRFWAKVDQTDTCWLWTAALMGRGYGSFGLAGRTYLAHRLAYEDQVGPIPDGLTIDHLCMVKACVNPAHLEPVPIAENVRRYGASITHCLHGHLYTPANTLRHGKGTRACRTCDRARQREAYRRTKQAA